MGVKAFKPSFDVYHRPLSRLGLLAKIRCVVVLYLFIHLDPVSAISVMFFLKN